MRVEWFGAALRLAAFGVAIVACSGYRVIRTQGSGEAFHVAVVRVLEADALAADEVASGVRDELARAGALTAGEGWPRVEVEVLSAGESAIGIVDVGGLPQAGGLGVEISARAWLSRSPDAPPERDTGDCRAEVAIAVDAAHGVADTRRAAAQRSAALRAAGRRLGRELARHVVGLPMTTDEGPEL